MDRLDRAQFAESLSTSIGNLEGNDSFVVGLCGPWGSGKTSVLNFVVSGLESAEDEGPVLLRFNPWWFSGREQLLEAFLSQFTAVLDMPNRGEKAKKASKLLGTLSAALRPVSLIPVIGEAAKAGKEVLDALAGATNAYADAVSRNVGAIRNEIDELLKDFPQRIVVVMDDIDRLAASEIAQLFLILKAVADFPRTVYLLAFDHKVVTQAVKEQLGVDGKTYLEKIIQLQIDVPPTAQTAIHHMFLEQLNELLEGEELSQQQTQYFWNVFHDGLKEFLITPRAAKKLINMLRFAYPPLRGEVNVVDMIGIACLTTFVPQVIPTMATNAGEFTGVGSQPVFGGHDDRKEREAFHRAWLSDVPEKERHAVEGIVKRLFPGVSHALGGSGYSSEFGTIWQRELRVCSSAHFEKYFRLAIPEGTISENEWNRVVEQFADPNALYNQVRAFANQGGPHGIRSRASEFLDRALLFARTADTNGATTLFQSLMRSGDCLYGVKDEETVGGMVPVDNTLRMTWVIHELLERLPKRQQREALILESLTQGVGLYVATELVVSLGYQNGTYGDGKEINDPRYSPIVSKSFVGRLAKQVRQMIGDALNDEEGDQLVTHSDFMKIVINWWRIGGKQDAKEWMRTATEDDHVLASALAQQISKTRMHGADDRTAIETQVIDTGFLTEFLNLKQVRSRCQAILADRPEWLDERGHAALAITVNSIKENGKPIDHWAERRRGGKPEKKIRSRKKKTSSSSSCDNEDS